MKWFFIDSFSFLSTSLEKLVENALNKPKLNLYQESLLQPNEKNGKNGISRPLNEALSESRGHYSQTKTDKNVFNLM